MSQIVYELTDFEAGMNGWQFKHWMPNGRAISGDIVDTDGFVSKHSFSVTADGHDDDGVFFLQKILKADIEGPFHQASIAWAFKPLMAGAIQSWPRIAYIGPPKDLAILEHKDKFQFFNKDDGTSTCETCDGWHGQMYRRQFEDGLDAIQICVGFKINWEDTRTVFLDNLVLYAF
jgi:hypothetical protein